jgi:hypothetical protein
MRRNLPTRARANGNPVDSRGPPVGQHAGLREDGPSGLPIPLAGDRTFRFGDAQAARRTFAATEIMARGI